MKPADSGGTGRRTTQADRATAQARKPDTDLGALAGDVGFLVRRAQVWIFNDFLRTLAPCGLRPAQYAVLTVVEANPGLSQMSLSRALGIERAHLMRMLDAMEDREWLARTRPAGDRRSHALHLTPVGMDFMEKARKLVAVHEANVVARLGPERLGGLLDALAVFR